LFVALPIQSNPIFIVKTQLAERSGITDKHRENHIKKHHEHIENEKKVMRMTVMKSVGVLEANAV